LNADTQVHSRFANPKGKFIKRHHSHGASARGIRLGEVLWTHTYLYGILRRPAKIVALAEQLCCGAASIET
jgi:hypothetical protein